MVLPIPIPIGSRNVATVRGAVWKQVLCVRCQQQFAYLLELEATGVDHDLLFLDAKSSVDRARAQAEEYLVKQSQNRIVAIPCPKCGAYQPEMVEQIKVGVSINAVQIAGLVLVFLSVVPLAIDSSSLWALTVVLATAGLALVAYGYRLAFGFDPNAGDPESRIELARKHTVWGGDLEKIIASSQQK